MRRNVKVLAFGASCLGLFIGTTAANADGYERRGSIKDYTPRCASFNGFYLGGNVGWGYFDHTWSDRDAWAKNELDHSLPSSVSGTNNGWLAGVQGGYNYQRGCTVFGLEADWSWANLDRSTFHTDGQPGAALDRLRVTSEIKSFGTLRTRTGVVVDNLLLYATGGLAWANVKSSWTATDNIEADSSSPRPLARVTHVGAGLLVSGRNGPLHRISPSNPKRCM